MPKMGDRGYRFALWCLLAGVLLSAFAIQKDVKDMMGLAALVTGVVGSAGAPFAYRGAKEWEARAKDQSSIPQQAAGVTAVLPNQVPAGQ